MNALYVICGLGFASLIAEIANLKKGLSAFIFIGLAATVVLLILDWSLAAEYYNNMLVFDNFAIAFSVLIVLVSLGWFWMAGDYFKDQPHQTDRSALVLFVITGAIIMVSFNNMAMLFLGIEILSISLYTLAGSNKDSLRSNEASFKYFLMGSFATGFLLMGMALVYGATGSFHITTIATYISNHSSELPAFFYAGVLLMLVGMTFKISAVPFHFWAPDVYEGSPVMITAFMSTVVKIAAVAAFFRVFAFCFGAVQSSWVQVLGAIVVLTLIVPNVTAVYQSNVKRMLAYSSVGHVGYLLLAFIASGSASMGTIFYYLTAYAIASLAAFSVLQKTGEHHDFNGLMKRNPLLAIVMTISLLSLAGIPPLAGFFGKYLVFNQALANGYIVLVVIAVVTSLIGVYYYLRVILSMFLKEPEQGEITLSFSYKVLTILLVFMIFIIGLFPNKVVELLGN